MQHARANLHVQTRAKLIDRSQATELPYEVAEFSLAPMLPGVVDPLLPMMRRPPRLCHFVLVSFSLSLSISLIVFQLAL